MYMVLDKEKPRRGKYKRLNMGAVSHMTVQLTKCSLRVLKRYNMLHKPALTEPQYSVSTKGLTHFDL
jgi:hypothetical protein